MKVLMISLFSLLLTSSLFAQCLIENSRTSELNDSLAGLLSIQNQCPQNVFQLKQILNKESLNIASAMVANRGKHNPAFGSFSIFESVSGHSTSLGQNIQEGHFFFGHFTSAQSSKLDFDQEPRMGKLMIEAIVWDNGKEVFNFYELIGTNTGGKWFYRGDSKDAIEDNLKMHLQDNPNAPSFGNNMRCSACHTSGGPIMKELEAPHNDWWTKKGGLIFSPNKPNSDLQLQIDKLVDASEFANLVKKGITELEQSHNFNQYKDSSSLQQQLKPLFCTNEINLISDSLPLESPTKSLQVSSAFWINPFFISNKNIEIEKSFYLNNLKQFNFSFPEVNRIDADHAWVSPVKGYVDQKSIQELIKKQIISEEFVLDVLSIDMINPLFSSKRCSLLKDLPLQGSNNWLALFKKSLQANSSSSAKQLLKHLEDKNKEEHLEKASLILAQIQTQAQTLEGVKDLVIKLHQKRTEVFQNEISKNPLGQILEPGFRVIFPMPN